MHMPNLSKKAASCVLGLSLVLSVMPVVLAQSGETVQFSGVGKLIITQVGPQESPELLGKWTLFEPDNNKFVAEDRTFTFTDIAAGSYTFTSDIPEGASAVIELTVDGVLSQTVNRQQLTFPINGGQVVSLKITYSFTRVGTVSVTSKPSGMKYTLKGPNGYGEKGTTPGMYEKMPEGLYTAYFDLIPDCITPKPKSDKLLKDGRITLAIEVACDALNEIPQTKEEEKALEFVTIIIDGKSLTFEDAKSSEWFAQYIAKVTKNGIMSGYSDANGNLTGKFGPGDSVTLAQLAKIAHRMSGLDETKVEVPVRNTRADGQWYERFWASAEQNWWEVFRDTRTDPNRPATRAEVVATLLRSLDVPTVWPKGKTFQDVLPTLPYAHAIETAVADGIVDTASTSFRPNDPINRAEMAKMLTLMTQQYIETSAEIRGGSY
ncbi:S-layer homology domain-containing protein [Candidatus Peregrinibacteria bacterium]|nr:S-layer homology domain-containing protein [Candidatus Peregrinibacteria bacterium]